MEYIIIIGAFQALLALCLFVVNRQKKPADNLLTWILICLFAHLSIKFIIYAAPGNAQLKMGFNTFIDLGYGPLLWMYARKVQHDRYRPVQHWFLLLPTFAAGAMYTMIALKVAIVPTGVERWLFWYNEITQYLIIVSMSIFPVLALRISFQLPSFWKSERQLIKKIAVLFLVIPALWMVTKVTNVRELLGDATLNLSIRLIAYSNSLIICLFIIQYQLEARILMKSATIPESQPAAESDFPTPAVLEEVKESLVLTVATPIPAEGVPVARKSTLTALQQEAIAIKLSELMQEKKVYTDPELTLEKLSALVKTPRHHLSEVLNQYLHQTFYQYINDHRMKEVLHLLDHCRQHQVIPNILSLAYDAGFNSKSSFNQYFKKTTGYTPTEYLKQPRKADINRLTAAYISLQQTIQPH